MNGPYQVEGISMEFREGRKPKGIYADFPIACDHADGFAAWMTDKGIPGSVRVVDADGDIRYEINAGRSRGTVVGIDDEKGSPMTHVSQVKVGANLRQEDLRGDVANHSVNNEKGTSG